MLGIQKISMNYINHPFAKYMLMLIREDPTLDEAAEREGCAPHFGLNSNGGVCSAHEIAVVLGWLKLSLCVAWRFWWLSCGPQRVRVPSGFLFLPVTLARLPGHSTFLSCSALHPQGSEQHRRAGITGR